MSRAPVRPTAGTVVVETGALQITAAYPEPRRTDVRVEGEIDLANAELLVAVLDNHLALGRTDIHLDLSGLTFLDGAGLRAIITAHNRFASGGGRLVLTGVGKRIEWLLRVTHLDEVLFVADRLGDSPGPLRIPCPPEPDSSVGRADLA